MPYTTVNFSDVEDFSALPEGEYGVEIDKVEVRRNKADDGDYLNWEFVVLDGDYENRRLWLITSLKPTALFRLKDVLEQLDVLDSDEIELEYDDDQEVTSSSGPRLLYPDVEGIEATVRVTNEMYDGRERNRVEEVFTGGRKKKAAAKKTKARKQEEDDSQYDVDGDEDEAPPRRSNSRQQPSRSRRDGRSDRRRLR